MLKKHKLILKNMNRC